MLIRANYIKNEMNVSEDLRISRSHETNGQDKILFADSLLLFIVINVGQWVVIWDWPCTSLGVQHLHVLHGCHGAVVRLGWGQLELKEHLLFKIMKYYTILKYLKKKTSSGA